MKWEYRRVNKSLSGTGGEQVDAELARLGRDGWEAVGVAVVSVNSLVVLLKRPVDQ